MSAWEEALRFVQEQSVGEWGDALVRQDAEKLAKLLAARDAAVWAQACEAAAKRCDRLRIWGDDFIGTGNSKAWARAAESLAVQIRALTPPQNEGPPE